MSSLFASLRGTPFLVNPFTFFDSTKKDRVCVFFTDSETQWKRDLILGERTFSDVILFPIGRSYDADVNEVKEILEKRMAYPGIQESPETQEIAKTWILPKKLHLGPEATAFLVPHEGAFKQGLQSFISSKIPTYDNTLQVVKIDVKGGLERQIVYKMLDDGFRPSLLIVNWSEDLDAHYSTAICAGHLLNCGYNHVFTEGSQSLYMFADQPLYDICSLKETGMTNPFMNTILKQLSTTPQSVAAPSTILEGGQ